MTDENQTNAVTQAMEEKLICDIQQSTNISSVVEIENKPDENSTKEPATIDESIKTESEQPSEVKLENETKDSIQEVNAVTTNEQDGEPGGSSVITQDEWAKRESELLEKISKLEAQSDDTTLKGMQIQLKVKCEENEILKAKLINMQTELSAVMKKPNAKNKDIVSKIKKQHEDLLTKAKGMIFDKTKMIKNQELQIEALTAQVSSLKEVATITKNLLEIRNLEVVHLQERLEVMDMKLQAEKERHNLMIKKIESGTSLNAELKKEYEKQLLLFKELKIRYEEKFAKLEEQLSIEKDKNNIESNN